MTTATWLDRSPWAVDPILKNSASPDQASVGGRTTGAVNRSASPSSASGPSAKPRVEDAPPRQDVFTWVGAHGGAGTSSLAAGSGRGLELSRCWPDPAIGWPPALVLVCRTNAAGLLAAGRMLADWTNGPRRDLQLLAVITVADAPGRLPRTLRMRLAELDAAAPELLSVPWIEDWREHPYVAHPAARAAADRLITLIGKEN